MKAIQRSSCRVMKKLYTSIKGYTAAVGLIILALSMIALVVFLVTYFYSMFDNTSYKFIIIFLLIIILSNILAKIAHKYIQL